MAGLSKVKGSGLATGAATASLVGIDDNATSTAITIDASENVGIGTTTPDGKLHIDGTSTTVTGLVLEAGMDGDCRSVDFHNSDGNKRMGIVYDNTNIKLNITDRSENKLVTIGELTGDVTVGTGNLVIGTSGKGIDFSATSDGSGTMTSEVLDDYEEGTWTASLTGNGSAPSTAATATGTYTKIGRQVTVHVYLANKNTSGASGEMQVTGLPFNPSQSTTGVYASYGLEAQGSFCVAYARTSGTVEFLEMNDGAVWGAVQIVAGSSKYLDLAMTYET